MIENKKVKIRNYKLKLDKSNNFLMSLKRYE
jgi:hypothetical protein